MRRAITDDSLGFMYEKRQSRRFPAKYVTDFDFADDIALVSSTVENAQFMLQCIEREALKVGLKLNQKKTEYIIVGKDIDKSQLIYAKNGPIKLVEDFKYLGSWLMRSQKDFEVRKAIAWSAATKMCKIWRSNLSRECKIKLFTTTVESVLLYSAETWSISETFEKRLNGCYTKLLRYALNIKWTQHISNVNLYQDVPLVGDKIRYRRLQFAGHCLRANDQLISDLIFWDPPEKYHQGMGVTKIYPKVLCEDVRGLFKKEVTDIYEHVKIVKVMMMNRDEWRESIKRLLKV